MTIKVFVGCAPNHEDVESQAVLEWSIRKHVSQPVDIEWMKLSKDSNSFWYSENDKGWQTTHWATPFSGFRWAIPLRAQAVRAIYMDSDFMVFDDLAKLWSQPAANFAALAKGRGSWRYCMSLWNCPVAESELLGDIGWLRSDPMSHRKMTQHYMDNPRLTKSFEGDWNCLDGEGHKDLKDGTISALHYTEMSTQPQLKYAVPRLAEQGRKHWYRGTMQFHPRQDVQQLFDEMLVEAKKNGYAIERYMQEPIFGKVWNT